MAFVSEIEEPKWYGGKPSTFWNRLVHSTTLLGYSFLLSLLETLVLIIPFSQAAWTEPDERGVPTFQQKVLQSFSSVGVVIALIITTSANIIQAEDLTPDGTRDGGPKYGRVTIILGVPFVLSTYVIGSIVVIPRYYGLDLLFGVVIVMFYIVAQLKGRAALKSRDDKKRRETSKEVEDNTERTEDVETNDSPGGAKQIELNKSAEIFKVFFQVLPLIIGTTLGLLYPLFVIPNFVAGGPTTRLLIALVLHPLLLEGSEASLRAQGSAQVASELAAGKIKSLEEAERCIMQSSTNSFGIKQLLAFYRRFMLLNMGSPETTIIAIVAAAIEEALSRGFLVEIDLLIRRASGAKELEGKELWLQRLMWMADANRSAIAEFNAIILSSITFVLMEPHKLVFALGYEHGQPLDFGVVFVQLLIELGLELAVDNTAMWTEAEHGIPITEYFPRARTSLIFLFQAGVGYATLMLSMYSFLRVPFVTTCDHEEVCLCTEPYFTDWYNEYCITANTSNTSTNTTVFNNTLRDHQDPFDNVDSITVLVAVVSSLSILSLIILSVLFARYRKRNKVVKDISHLLAVAGEEKARAEEYNKELKDSLNRAQKEVEKAVGDAAEFLKQFSIKHAELKFEEEIGHGSFGVVWRGEFRLGPVAIKTCRVTKITPRVVREFMDEIKLMAPLAHKNLVGLRGGCWKDGPDKLCLVLEFCARGTLKDLLNATSKHDLAHNWSHPFFNITSGIASCFRYFHHEQPSGEALLHRDLKPENVLITDEFEAKVADLGASRRYDPDEARRRIADHDGESMLSMTQVGTPIYTAPEILAAKPYTKSVDVYSFAVTLLEIGCRDHVFVVNQFKEQSRREPLTIAAIDATEHEGFRPIPKSELVDTLPLVWIMASVKIKECWDANPKNRPTFVAIVHRLNKMDPTTSAVEASGTSTHGTMLFSDQEAAAASAWFEGTNKTFVAFLSHHKEACAAEARLVKHELDRFFLGAESFLDSDNLQDLRELLEHVRNSSVLVVFQSRKVLERPWCLLELYTAIMEGVPIVALNCAGKGYDFGKAADLLLHLETKLNTLNPSAVQVLKQNGVDVLHAAHVLSSVLPNIISVHFNASASRVSIKASMVELVQAMIAAKSHPVTSSLEEWLEERSIADVDNDASTRKADGSLSGTMKGQVLAKASRADELLQEVAELKNALAEKDKAIAERETEFKSELVTLRAEKEKAIADRDAEFKSIIAGKDQALAQKDQDMYHALAEKDQALAKKDEALAQKDLRIQKLTDKLLNID